MANVRTVTWRNGIVVALVVALGALVAPAIEAPPAGAVDDVDTCFIDATHRVFLDREANENELTFWRTALAGGTPRYRISQELAASDEWLTVEVTKLYQQALDRDPDSGGLAYWIDQLRRGALVNRIASLIYGSDEFYAGAGGTDDGFLTDLYVRILGREPDAGGLDHWRGELARLGRGRVASLFFASVESRRDRVTRLYQAILDRAPDADGLAHWVEQLKTVNDVRLAVLLASGQEFFDRATAGCVPTPPPTVTFEGRGWGHGRGMSQWGARGYADDGGDGPGGEAPWSGGQILDHFYGGTVTSTRPTDVVQRVYLTASRGQDLIVTQDAAALRVDGHAVNVAAVKIARLGVNSFQVSTSATVGCNGPWTPLGGPRAVADVEVQSQVAQTEEASTMLQRCVTSGSIRYYRGSLHAVEAPLSGLGAIATVNEVSTETMLRSIVPGEMPALWAAAAVRSQAVAARSYALAGDTRWGSWATTCDSTTCQVYPGYGSRPVGGSTVTRSEHPDSDQAVLATARQVRTFVSGGAIARTEFASSSGGWTAGGDFRAVVDAGDDHPGNAYHDWTETFTRAEVEAALDAGPGTSRGTFIGFDSYVRNGLGELGGRVTTVRARFANADVTFTGDQIRSRLALRSNWFQA